MNNSFTSNEKPLLGARRQSRNLSAQKHPSTNEPVNLNALYSSAMANPKTDQPPRIEKSTTKEIPSTLTYSQQKYLHIKHDKPFTSLQKCYPVVKKEGNRSSMGKDEVSYGGNYASENSMNNTETSFSFLKGKMNYTIHSDNKHAVIMPTMTTLVEHKHPVARLGSSESKVRKEIYQAKRYQSVERSHEYHSSGGMGYTSLLNGSNISINLTNASFEKERATPIPRQKRGSIVEKVHRESSGDIRAMDSKVLDEFEDKHKAFVNSMKILQELTSQVDISNDHVVRCIQKQGEKGGENVWSEAQKEILINEIEQMLDAKIKSRPLGEKMKKEHIEDFGSKLTVFLKKIGEGLAKQGCADMALMLMTLNKILALELEDIYASYVFQIQLIKQNPEKELISELIKERAKNKQLNVMMKLRNIGFQDAAKDIHRQIDLYKNERDEFEEQIRKQDNLIQSLLKQIKRGLTKPLELDRAKSKKNKKIAKDPKRTYSLDLDAIDQEKPKDFLPEKRKKRQ